MKKVIHNVHYASRTDKSDYSENDFLISNPKTYVVDTQKNRLNENIHNYCRTNQE